MLIKIYIDRHIGGGVLSNGCEQEEIKFATSPELIAALFFAEPLEDKEALVITGAKPYSTYKGSGRDFEFGGEADLQAPSSQVVIAFDDFDFSSKIDTQVNILEEIVNAYAGFKECPTKKITTGNWGGGALKVC